MSFFDMDGPDGGIGGSSPPPLSEDVEDEDMDDLMDGGYEPADSQADHDMDPEPSEPPDPLSRTVTFTDELPQQKPLSSVSNPSRPSAHVIEDLFGDATRTEELNDMDDPDGTSLPRLTSPRSPYPRSDVPPTPITPLPRLRARQELFTAKTYDIVPTIAIPQATSINAMCMTKDFRWVLTGGDDGMIRKYNWIDTANGKLPLTVAQRHPFVDSVTKAGVLLSYFDNSDPSIASKKNGGDSLSPVYSLAVQNEGIWIASGMESGVINFYSLRVREGEKMNDLRGHSSAVSCLSLAPDQRSLLSGSWDKMVLDWDLNKNRVKRSFEGSQGQISCIAPQPECSMDFPDEEKAEAQASETVMASEKLKTGVNGVNGSAKQDYKDTNEDDANLPSPVGSMNSLFGDDNDTFDAGGDLGMDDGMNDDLFGDNDDSNEFTRAIAAEPDEPPTGLEELKEPPDLPRAETSPKPEEAADPKAPLPPHSPNAASTATLTAEDKPPELNGVRATPPRAVSPPSNSMPTALPNGTALLSAQPSLLPPRPDTAVHPTPSETIFLTSSIDGTLRLHDRRQQHPICSIPPRLGTTPPWCTSVCWSPNGQSFYAGRRDGKVEEYSLHNYTLKEPRNTMRFPSGSGPVSCVRAMMNGRHLVCGSWDIMRLYDLQWSAEGLAPALNGNWGASEGKSEVKTPFLIIPGHRGGMIAQMEVDELGRYLIGISGSRGWEGSCTEVLLGYEIHVPK